MAIADLQGFGEKWGRVRDSYLDGGLSALTENEQKWFTVQMLVWSVQNGGLISYYYNADSDHVKECLEALRSLGLKGMVKLVERVNALFQGGVPQGQEAVNVIIDSWADEGPENDVLVEVEEVESKEARIVEKALEKFVQHTFLRT